MRYEGYLPISKEDMIERGIEKFDFVYVIGDAYVDHPSFGPAIISRILESRGFSVGIISQPDWKDDASIAIMGEPRLGFLVLRISGKSFTFVIPSPIITPTLPSFLSIMIITF